MLANYAAYLGDPFAPHFEVRESGDGGVYHGLRSLRPGERAEEPADAALARLEEEVDEYVASCSPEKESDTGSDTDNAAGAATSDQRSARAAGIMAKLGQSMSSSRLS